MHGFHLFKRCCFSLKPPVTWKSTSTQGCFSHKKINYRLWHRSGCLLLTRNRVCFWNLESVRGKLSKKRPVCASVCVCARACFCEGHISKNVLRHVMMVICIKKKKIIHGPKSKISQKVNYKKLLKLKSKSSNFSK